MSSLLRVMAAACAAPLLIAGTAAAAIAAPAGPTAAQFSITPTYGAAGQMITMTAKGGWTFANGEQVSFNGATSAVSNANGGTAQVAVPSGATTGPMSVTDGTTTYNGPKFILQQPVATTITSSRGTVLFGKKILIRATASSTGLGGALPAAGLKAHLLHRTPASPKWRQVAKAHTTNSNGAVHWRTAPTHNGRYEVQFRGTQSYQPATTAMKAVAVKAKLHVDGFTTAPALTTTPITGTVAPGKPGQLELQKKTAAGAWHTIARSTPRNGKFRFTISPTSYRTVHYRVVDLATRLHSAAVSKTLHVTIVHRALKYGDSGADVTALWKRLKQLHYDVGPKPSSYGWDLVHAVTAFEKVNRLDKDGSAGISVWKKLSHPRVAHLQNTSTSGYAVEVNMAKEILLISKNGKVWRILDTSTGGGYEYTDSAGQPAIATTPTGHFNILYKQTGWQKSKLGELYYPSYFTNTGVAIHGEGDGNDGGEVPPYAASHGCVRITNSAVLRYYYSVFTDGTPVWVYG